jgi:hypothetical protein
MASGKGFDALPLRIPEKWDAVWFLSFVRDVLALGDVRNADSGPGISVDSTTDGTATISGNADIGEIADGNFVLAEASAGLANARILAAENGVLAIEDHGAGSTIRIVVVDNGIYSTKLRKSPALTVLGAPSDTPADQNVQDIPALSNDTVLRRTGDALDFGTLTLAMAPDALWTYAKIQDVSADRVLGRKTSTGVTQELTANEVLAMLGAAADGALIVKSSGAWSILAPGADGKVLTMVSGAPAWADLPAFALASKSFVTSADETATLPNSRQLVSGTGSTVNTATASQIKVDVP